MWGKRYSHTMLVGLHICASTIESFMESPKKTRVSEGNGKARGKSIVNESETVLAPNQIYGGMLGFLSS